MAKKTNSSEGDILLSIGDAAARIGVSAMRLFKWMDSHEWLVIGDLSSTVNWDEVNVTGHLACKNGSVFVTPKGLQYLIEHLNSGRPTQTDVALASASDVPF